MTPSISIPGTNKSLGGDEVFVIAEIGKNFIQSEDDRPVEEYLANAKALIQAAAEAGADAVKFQTHVLEDEFMPGLTVTSPHFKGSDRYAWIRRNEAATPDSFWHAVKSYADELGIVFFSTPMSRKASEKLESFGVPLWKIGSGDVQDNVTLDYIAQTGKPLIISTGMVSLAELDDVVAYIQAKNTPLVVLYCVSQYPCPPDQFNLATIELFKEKYPDVVIGFSDHSVDGHDVDLAAVKLGARVIEKHFSFSRDLWGSDHKASILPSEMRVMVDAIRSKEYERTDEQPFRGSKDRELEGANNQFRPYFNKALVAGCDIPNGAVIEKHMIFAVRPKMYVDGLSAEKFEDVVGRTTKCGLHKYQPIKSEDIE